ncbi:SDR family oxidoreductase [Hyphomicrobium sp.]|jgi:3-oxoacyl-[acyl-carrier protein] reductase|uniref:SDR family oxidoreductase n=1 Tax=Hyphomicrobium sp. TaxID=82 RepID=UPI002D7E9A5B|nr:SDR family oxidoreductase [Hyphomicrobium sp.]
MYMDRVSTSADGYVASEFAQARILITGLTATAGVDVARSFADVQARVIVHTADLSPELIELVAVLTQSADEIRLHTNDISTADTAATFAQTSAQTFGGLDAAINMASVSRSELEGIVRDQDLDAFVSTKLGPLAQLTRVIANRMALVLSEGLILNVLEMPHPRNRREAAVAGYIRTALATMTTNEAHAWAAHGIRINAVGPCAIEDDELNAGAVITNEPDIGSLALYLASRKGQALSGHVFDADGVAC